MRGEWIPSTAENNMGIIKKLVLLPITLIAALGWVLHIYSMMVAGLLARDEKRLLILAYITEAKELAERTSARVATQKSA